MSGNGGGEFVRAIAPLVFVSLLSGCSFVLVKGRPSAPVDPNGNFDCTTSQAAPVVDIALGLLSAGSGAVALANVPSSPCSDYSCVGGDVVKGFGIAALAVGAVYLASGVYGFVKTSGCRDAVAAQRACLDGDRNTCNRLTQAPNGAQQ
jgi:hypothetical protein